MAKITEILENELKYCSI